MHLNVYLLVVVLHMYFYFQLKENKDKENTLPCFFFFQEYTETECLCEDRANSKAIQTLTKAKTVNLYRFEKKKRQPGIWAITSFKQTLFLLNPEN